MQPWLLKFGHQLIIFETNDEKLKQIKTLVLIISCIHRKSVQIKQKKEKKNDFCFDLNSMKDLIIDRKSVLGACWPVTMSYQC